MELHETILSNTYTKADYLRRVRYLRGYFEYKYYTKESKSGVVRYLKQHDADPEDVAAMKAWGKEFYKSFSKNNFYDLIRELRDDLKKINSATVYISYTPEDGFEQRLGRWFRQNNGGFTMVDLRFDESVIGGCAVVWNSIYRDLSIRSKVASQRYRIMSLLDNNGDSK